MAEPFIGEIKMFGGNFAPTGYALCNGQLLNISQNTALFSILGTSFGGDGIHTFALPNMQGRVPIHQGSGQSVYTVGESTGAENVTLSVQQMPQHTHTYSPQANNGAGASARPSGGYPANSGGAALYATSTDGTTMGAQTIGNTGGHAPVSVVQPVLCVTFIIALVGIFPSRN